MYEFLQRDRYAEFDEFVRRCPYGDFLQSTAWSAFKDAWRNTVLVIRNNKGDIIAGTNVLIRKLPVLPFRILYAPRGPLFLHDGLRGGEELRRGLDELARREKAYAFFSDPAIPVLQTEAAAGLRALGFTVRQNESLFGSIQPCCVCTLDIKGKTEDEVFGGFKSKTRYNIRLAARSGVTARVGSAEDIPAFCRLMEETGKRDGFIIRPEEYFSKMLKTLPEDMVRLYVTEREGRMLSGAVAVHFGSRVWYLYGASGNEERRYMPNHLMQWEMIRWAIREGCDVYDFRGIARDIREDSPAYGLYRFKKGFGGERTEYIGEVKLVWRKWTEWLISMYQKLRR